MKKLIKNYEKLKQKLQLNIITPKNIIFNEKNLEQLKKNK